MTLKKKLAALEEANGPGRYIDGWWTPDEPQEARMTGLNRKWNRKSGTNVTAVRLDLDTDGFTYQKWGGSQRCKAGDWLLNNAGEVYTVDATSFEATYRQVSPGVYTKSAPVWARLAGEAGSIETKEGFSSYEAGDMLVFNDEQQADGYAISLDKFQSLYELAK